MTTDRPMVYVARMDVEPGYLDRFEQWYESKHGPDLIRSGFGACVAYHAIEGAPLVHNFYMIPSADIFSSARYQSARTPVEDPQRPEVLANVSNRSNTPYRQHHVAGGTAHDAVAGEYAVTVEFADTPPSHSDTDRAQDAAARGAWSDRWRLCIRDGVHPNNPQRAAHGLIVIELATESDAQRVAAEIRGPLRGGIADALGAHEVTVLRRRTALVASPS